MRGIKVIGKSPSAELVRSTPQERRETPSGESGPRRVRHSEKPKRIGVDGGSIPPGSIYEKKEEVVKKAEDLAKAIGKIGQMECQVKDCLTCKRHIEEAADLIREDRKAVIEECINICRQRSIAVMGRTIVLLNALKAEIGGK